VPGELVEGNRGVAPAVLQRGLGVREHERLDALVDAVGMDAHLETGCAGREVGGQGVHSEAEPQLVARYDADPLAQH
jgi:hypothetical protein